MQRSALLLAAETGASLPTVKKWIEDPDTVTKVHDYALRAAAKALKLEDAIADHRRTLGAVALGDEQATGTEG